MDLEKIKKISWYRQETAGNPYFIIQACRGCVQWFANPDNKIFWYCKPTEAKAYLDKDLMDKYAEEYLLKEKKQPGFLQRLFDAWHKDVVEHNEALYRQIDHLELSNLDDSKLLELNKELGDHTLNMWVQFFVDVYDLDSEGLVEKELVEYGITLSDQDRGTMMMQDRLLAYQRHELDLLRIVRMVKDTPGALNTLIYITSPSNLHRLKIYPAIEKALAKHQQDYFWLQNSWGSTRLLEVFDFVEEIKQILNSSRNISTELDKLISFRSNIFQQKSAIAEKNNFDDWLNSLFNFFSLLAYWRDLRKEQVQKMNHYLELVGKEIAKRSNLSWEEFNVCDPLLIDKLPISQELLAKCKDIFSNRPLMHWDGKEVSYLPSKEGNEIFKTIEQSILNEFTEIRGMIACPGKVRGKVVVINSESEFHKMEEGDILVSVNTRPEFVPLMKKAGAIVTDEGGITSHAAVVSRELKVPCIIGTQVGTRKLKDGDKVLVNANHGVVIVEEK